ncbi:helix-turn-helix domain-containing protein [uncultured Ruegeria sp.]|uniref:GlxA family transcriptional regulator n=1 Tax=uncultured Ruegeria sp. TaxID=259304 RepID=UPI00261C36FF|nr:helix-turn-helix domain-containing protein [uncultured Ruegeria sp.]
MDEATTTFEIFVQNKFSDLEVSSVATVLSTANQVLNRKCFRWVFVSDTPGLVQSRNGMIVRAEPSVFDHNLKEFMVVVGGDRINSSAWSPRARAMQRSNRHVVMLSEAATAFIRDYRSRSFCATTHWRDVQVLEELGDFPNVSLRYAEVSGSLVTSTGGNYTSELVIDLIASSLSHQEKAEIGSRLVLQSIRDRRSKQPCGTTYLMNAFGPQILRAIRIMEDNVECPISTRNISMRLGLSVRQLERVFTKYTGTSPGRYYKKIRVGRAHNLVTETNMTLVDVALATGFGSVASLTSAYRTEFGKSPREIRVKGGHSLE